MANTKSLDLEASSSQYASRADTASLSLTGDLTFELWYKPEHALADGERQMFISKYGSAPNRSYAFEYYRSASTYYLRLFVSADGTNISQASKSITALSSGTWYHIAVAYTASVGSATFYVDADNKGSVSGLDNSIVDESSPFYVGCWETGGGEQNFVDGLIDEVRIWNDVRTNSEIADNYKTELDGDETGLVAYYKFNDDATDSQSDGNNDLTLSGSPSYSSDVPSWTIPFEVIDSLGMSDSETALRTRLFNISENTALVESITALKGISFNVSDDAIMSDVISILRTMNISVSEVMAMSDESLVKLLWEKIIPNTSNWTKQTPNTSNWTKQ